MFKKSEEGISRRSFLKGFGAAATAGVAAATVGSMGVGTAFAENSMYDEEGFTKIKSASHSENDSWLGEAPEIAESEITETLSTEVLVVGCGTAGWPAALTAAEEGAKVLVVERLASATKPKEDIGALNSSLQKASFAQYPQFEIDKKEALEDIVRYADGYVNYDLIKLWEDESGALVDWYQKILEDSGLYHMEFEGGIGTRDGARDKAYATGHSPQKNSSDFKGSTLDALQPYADKLGIEWRLKCNLIKLEQDGSGRVTGIIGQDMVDFHYVRITASKGVILTTGGYATNKDMMNALQPEIQALKICVDGSGNSNTGDGIKAGMWIGARKDPIGTSMLFNRACCLPTDTAGFGTPGKWFWFGEQPNLKVNLNGVRFCNESGPYDYMLHSSYMQPHHTYCDIWDANHQKYAQQFDEVGCCRLFPFDNGSLNNIPMKVVEGMIDKLIEAGYVVKADSLQELADGLNIPADAFIEQVEKYNSYAAAGYDPDYYKEPHRITPVDTAPFYGARVGAWHLTTLDGLNIDTSMRVLDQNNDPIEGLYASGDCSGGFFSTSYPNLFTGLACGRSMTFGRHVGKIVAHL